MTLGSVVWRCPLCKRNSSERFCDHPKASWSIVYYVNGKATWRKATRNKSDAQALLNRINSDILRGNYPAAALIRFQDLANRFLKQDAEVLFKPSTIEYYRERIKALLPTFGNLLATDITLERVKEFRATALQSGQHPGTVNKNVGTLRRILNAAVEVGYLSRNPLRGMQRVPEGRPKIDFLTSAELVTLFKHAEEPSRTIFMTAALAGLREGEILGLRREDLDWQDDAICVRQNLVWYQASNGGRTWKLTTPKTRASSRRVPMVKELREALQLHLLTASANPSNLVFCTQASTPIDPHNLIRREFKPALARAGLRPVRFHDLRHSFVAMLLGLNVNLKVIQELVGHASIQTTMDIYGHLLPETKKQAVERISETLQEASHSNGVVSAQAPALCDGSS